VKNAKVYFESMEEVAVDPERVPNVGFTFSKMEG
jgi:hypothetical protein